MSSEPLLTRTQAIELMRSEFGLPMSTRAFDCGPKRLALCGTKEAAPKPVTRYSRYNLYSPTDIRNWAKVLIARGAVR